MGQYLKTRYPGIFQYVRKNGTVYGVDYYAGGKKHREIGTRKKGETWLQISEWGYDRSSNANPKRAE